MRSGHGGSGLATYGRSPALLVTVIWIAMAILVNPTGEFPLNDDWAYAWSVKMLLEQGTFRLSDWTATNLLPQVVWGTVFCIPFGFSFTALRVSTLVAGLAGLLATGGVLKEIGTDRRVALLCLLAIAANPLYLALSSSFNSDVPSFAIFAGSLYFMVRGFARRSRWSIVLGVGLALAAVLQRQSNLVLLPGVGIAYLAGVRMTPRVLVAASVPAILGLGAQFSYAHWLSVTGRRPLLYGLQIDGLLQSLLSGQFASTFAWNSVVILLYMGLCLFPVLAVMFLSRLRTQAPQGQVAMVVVACVLVAGGLSLLGHERMPLTGNVLERAAIGPLDLESFESSLGETARKRLDGLWHGLTVIAVTGAAILLEILSLATWQVVRRTGHPAMLSTATLALSVTVLTVVGIGGLPPNLWFDRYLIVLLPALVLLAALITVNPSDGRPALSGFPASFGHVALVLMGTFSVLATHDYLAVNRARVIILNDAVRQLGLQPSDVDVGWENVGWHSGHRIERCQPGFDRSVRRNVGWEDFTCLSDGAHRPYGVSRRPLEHHVVVAQKSFRQWLPWRQDTVFLVRRRPS